MAQFPPSRYLSGTATDSVDSHHNLHYDNMITYILKLYFDIFIVPALTLNQYVYWGRPLARSTTQQ